MFLIRRKLSNTLITKIENKIVKITNSTFDGLGTLKKLDLSGNLLETLSSAFTRMPKLMTLILQNNQLQRNHGLHNF